MRSSDRLKGVTPVAALTLPVQCLASPARSPQLAMAIVSMFPRVRGTARSEAGRPMTYQRSRCRATLISPSPAFL